MIVRGAIFAFIFVIALILGLYAVPIAIQNSGIIAPSGFTYTILIGDWETIPFSTTNTSRIVGSFVATQPIDFYLMNASQFSSLDHNSYLSGSIYSVANASSFSIDTTVLRGDYFLVFFLSTMVQRPVYIRITSAIMAKLT
jgi:hypothetical protein